MVFAQISCRWLPGSPWSAWHRCSSHADPNYSGTVNPGGRALQLWLPAISLPPSIAVRGRAKEVEGEAISKAKNLHTQHSYSGEGDEPALAGASSKMGGKKTVKEKEKRRSSRAQES